MPVTARCGKVAEAVRKQGLLNVARDVKFLLQALALAFALHEARVVENAGGFAGEGVENLAIEWQRRPRCGANRDRDAEKLRRA